MSADADAAVARAAALCADLGHDVAPAPRALGDREAMDFLRYWALLAFSLKRFGSRVVGGPFETRRTEPLMDGLAAYAVDIAERLPWTLARLRRWRDRPENGSDVFDVLLSPVLAREPPPIGYLSPHLDLRTHIRRLISFAPVTACQNVTGSPAISLPLGRSAAGLPMGVQFVAPVGQESLLLELALELELAAPWRATPGGTDARG
jgi:amidase